MRTSCTLPLDPPLLHPSVFVETLLADELKIVRAFQSIGNTKKKKKHDIWLLWLQKSVKLSVPNLLNVWSAPNTYPGSDACTDIAIELDRVSRV